ncbi:MAG: hypothetical protein QOF72_297 [Blastocatellia bacterium]|nr:hypothetical protein [Blastocatellia bacterium]
MLPPADNGLFDDWSFLSFLFARVQIEQRQDYREQDNLPEGKHTAVEAAGLIVSVHVNNERSEADAGNQPDDLSLSVPHRIRLRALPHVGLLPRYRPVISF